MPNRLSRFRVPECKIFALFNPGGGADAVRYFQCDPKVTRSLSTKLEYFIMVSEMVTVSYEMYYFKLL